MHSQDSLQGRTCGPNCQRCCWQLAFSSQTLQGLPQLHRSAWCKVTFLIGMATSNDWSAQLGTAMNVLMGHSSFISFAHETLRQEFRLGLAGHFCSTLYLLGSFTQLHSVGNQAKLEGPIRLPSFPCLAPKCSSEWTLSYHLVS